MVGFFIHLAPLHHLNNRPYGNDSNIVGAAQPEPPCGDCSRAKDSAERVA